MLAPGLPLLRLWWSQPALLLGFALVRHDGSNHDARAVPRIAETPSSPHVTTFGFSPARKIFC
jgi:hypothetical protein